ncbi:unnamed protein product [Caenorhabditis brenneri]
MKNPTSGTLTPRSTSSPTNPASSELNMENMAEAEPLETSTGSTTIAEKAEFRTTSRHSTLDSLTSSDTLFDGQPSFAVHCHQALSDKHSIRVAADGIENQVPRAERDTSLVI